MALARTYDSGRGAIVVSLEDVFADRLHRWSDIQEYLVMLKYEASSREKPRILELGTRKGNSTMAFLTGTMWNGGHVWSVDINDIRGDPEGMFAWAKVPHWTFIHGDDMDPAVQAQLPGQADILFIDTSHEYDHTLAELRAYMPRVAPGGIALMHDTKLLMHRADELPPVKRALDEYCKETGDTWEELPGQYGMGILRR
jgi:cephalosporin hydroxylase